MMKLPEAGDVIDETYEIRRVLGKGGFGAVYLARQLNMDRDVALKLLVAGDTKFEEMVKRFRREVMAIRNLTHPNTIRVYDFRDNPEGLLYYTMEALRGRNLKEEVSATGPISPLRLKRVLRQVLKSLSEAHSHGLVHRDLKPANIMLVEMHGEVDFVKVLDFGIAKMMADDGEDGDDLTSAGILVGTIRYMAPEQIRAEYLGPQTDIYALGLIAVEMLTGSNVFAGTGRWDVLRKQISEEPVPMPRVVRESALGAVIRRCLEKDYRARFDDAAAVIRALDEIRDHELEEQSLFVPDGQGGWMPRVGEDEDVTSPGTADADEPDSKAMDSPVLHISARTFQPEEMEGEKALLTERPRMEAERGGPESGVMRAPVEPTIGQDSSETSEEIAALMNPGYGAVTAATVTVRRAVAGQKKTLTPLVLTIAGVALLVGLGAFYFLKKEIPQEERQEAEALAGDSREIGEVESEGAEAIAAEEAPTEGSEEFAEVQKVDIRTPGARARVFVGEELRGRTPLTLTLSDKVPVTVKLVATGYEDEILELDTTSPERLEVELVREVIRGEEVVRDEGRGEQASTSQSGGRSGNDRGGASEREVVAPTTNREVRRADSDSNSDSEPEARGESSTGWFEVEEEPEEEPQLDLW